jgi:putative transposase
MPTAHGASPNVLRWSFVNVDLYVFRNLTEVREHTERWLYDYHEEIPHTSLSGLTPVEYRQFHNPETSSYAWT